MLLFAFVVAHVEVNLDKPEASAPFIVYCIDDLPSVLKKEQWHDGFSSIQLKADLHWIIEDKKEEAYLMNVYRPDAILAKVPAFEYTLIHHKDLTNAKLPDNVVKEMDDARHHFNDSISIWKYWYYLLQFPPGVVLSSKKAIFNGARDDEDIDYEMYKIESKKDPDGQAWTFGDVVVTWLNFTVARTDT